MKKFLVYCLAAIMLVASFSVVASAAASQWEKGNGFHVYEPADPANPKNTGNRSDETRIETNSPVTIEDADGENGVKVAHRGYYESGDNWGGVVSKEMFGLNGLEVTVNFEEVPVVDGSDDCWIALDLVKECRSFKTGDNYNPGFINLVRFGRPEIELYGATAWNDSNNMKSGINGSDFAVKSGDTLKLSVKYDLGQYIMTITHNDAATWEVPAANTLKASDEVFTDGTAHVLVMASCFGVDKNFKYTVNVKPGVGLTEEEIANKEFEKSKAANYTAATEYAEEIEEFLADAIELVGESSEDVDVQSNLDIITAALATANESAETAKNAATKEESDAAAQAALDAKNEASSALKALETYVEEFGYEKEDTVEEETADDTQEEVVDEVKNETKEEEQIEGTSADDDKAESKGLPVWIWIAIAAAVVVVVVVVVVLGKKK